MLFIVVTVYSFAMCSSLGYLAISSQLLGRLPCRPHRPHGVMLGLSRPSIEDNLFRSMHAPAASRISIMARPPTSWSPQARIHNIQQYVVVIDKFTYTLHSTRPARKPRITVYVLHVIVRRSTTRQLHYSMIQEYKFRFSVRYKARTKRRVIQLSYLSLYKNCLQKK